MEISYMHMHAPPPAARLHLTLQIEWKALLVQ